MNRDQVNGRLEVAIGWGLGVLGTLVRNARLRNSGNREQIIGRARVAYGNAVAAVLRRTT